MKIRKIIAFLCAAAITAVCAAGCSKSDEGTGEAADTGYSGVLSKIRLGMPQNKVLALNGQDEVYYHSDSEIWCVNPDTDIMEMRELIPSEQEYYYCDDSIITYNFTYDDTNEQYILNSYTEEAVCLIDRETAEKYYEDKLKSLAAKYNLAEYVTTQLGVENVDMTFDYETVMTLPSFTVTTVMTMGYDTVNGVDGYYCKHFSITVTALDNKQAVVVGEVSASGEEESAESEE